MIVFAPYPIPVVTPLGDAYLIYVESSNTFENDVFTCCLCNGGQVRHFTTDQIKIFKNATFNIHEQQKSKKIKEVSKSNIHRQTSRRNRKGI